MQSHPLPLPGLVFQLHIYPDVVVSLDWKKKNIYTKLWTEAIT